ncbi:MAG: hypothetical protein U9R42_02780 [Bacteroidota bacterium]|nr:hypothetical protein [Bacteroidota bacterium]
MSKDSSNLYSYSDVSNAVCIYDGTNIFTGHYRIDAFEGFAHCFVIDTELVDNKHYNVGCNLCDKRDRFNNITGYYQIGEDVVYASTDTNDAIITNSIEENDINKAKQYYYRKLPSYI